MANTLGELKGKLNNYPSAGKQLYDAAVTVASFIFLLTLTLNAAAFAWMGWFLISFQVLSVLLKATGWRSIVVSPKESEYLISHPYRG